VRVGSADVSERYANVVDSELRTPSAFDLRRLGKRVVGEPNAAGLSLPTVPAAVTSG
jgi:hypothetical protein